MGKGKEDYKPPRELASFLERYLDAIYIGFGSLVVSSPEVCQAWYSRLCRARMSSGCKANPEQAMAT